MVQALNSAIDVMLGRDPDVVIFGKDVGCYGGVFRVTEGLQKKNGDHRVCDGDASGARRSRAILQQQRQNPPRHRHLFQNTNALPECGPISHSSRRGSNR